MSDNMRNEKDERIKKLQRKGLSVEQIARKIGYGNPPSVEGVKRVEKVIK